jgi:transcriptional regulator with XRE-family HTH domain
METETSFGAWIRSRRNALGLLQKELAHQVGCSVPALQKMSAMSGDHHARWLSGLPKPSMCPPMSALCSCRLRAASAWWNG